MSWTPGAEPRCEQGEHAAIDTIIQSRSRDLGAVTVRRVLPAAARRMVGPFIFFDHIGPVDLPAGRPVDVRPHPHIDLATVTYLFAGEMIHRDSLGSHQVIRPGAINWMTAGRGIVHSERSRDDGMHLHGLQLWVALPEGHQDDDPAFTHYPADSLPRVDADGARVRVLAGAAMGVSSPVVTASPLFYLDVELDAGARVPLEVDYAERAAYVAAGRVRCDGTVFDTGDMLVFGAGTPALCAEGPARVAVVGGDPVGPRHIWWNFVSASRERIEAAKADWAKGPGATERFPLVPGDEDEFTPLPDS